MGTAKSQVLIIDKRAVMGTEICRMIAAQGCRTDIFAGAASPAFRSRFCAERFVSPPFEDERTCCDALAEVVGAKTYDAIHVCHEEALSRILPFLDGANWSGLLVPPRDSLKVALSKNAALSLAAQVGIATPRTVIPERESDLADLARELGIPVVVKGDTGESGENVRIVSDPDDMAAQYRNIKARETTPGSRPALQEFIRGQPYSIGGLFLEGQPLRIIVHRKLIRYPHPWGGMTVKGVTESCPDLLREAFKVFEALNYTGLGHVEFIHDERDGRFKFIEINPRPWGTIGVAQLAGVDLFTPYRQLVKGIPVKADLRYRQGVIFHRILREARLIRTRPQRAMGFLLDVLDPRVRSDFSWTDPLPHLPSSYQLRKLVWPKQHGPKSGFSLENQSHD